MRTIAIQLSQSLSDAFVAKSKKSQQDRFYDYRQLLLGTRLGWRWADFSVYKKRRIIAEQHWVTSFGFDGCVAAVSKSNEFKGLRSSVRNEALNVRCGMIEPKGTGQNAAEHSCLFKLQLPDNDTQQCVRDAFVVGTTSNVVHVLRKKPKIGENINDLV